MGIAVKAKKIAANLFGDGALDARQLEQVFASGALDGFTPGIAKKLREAFGPKAAQAVLEWDHQAKSILGDKWNEASTAVLEHEQALPLISFLLENGIGGLLAKKVMVWVLHESDFDSCSDAIEAWRGNPYSMAEAPGISFDRADRMALAAFGVKPDSEERLLACAQQALSESCDKAGGGAPLESVKKMARELVSKNSNLPLAISAKLGDDSIELAQKKGLAKSSKDEDGSSAIYSTDLYEAEERSAHILLKRLHADRPLKIDSLEERIGDLEASSGLTLHDEQREAIRTMFGSQISIVCGKPGSGKTTLLKLAAPLLESGGKKVLYAAPTGKAAKRMSQSLGRHAGTLHRLLMIGKESGKGQKQAKAKGNSISEETLRLKDADAIVVDEASMIDSKMFLRLLKALGPSTSLILLGDTQQLPSVGAGKVLRDLIDSGRVPTAIMTKVMRASSQSNINTVARAIGEGQLPDFRDKAADCVFLDAPDEGRIAERISKMLLGGAKEKYDPLKDSQILCTGNEGPSGVKAMNAKLQSMLNPPAPGKKELAVSETLTLRVGDKVMQLSNDYERVLDKGSSSTADLFSKLGEEDASPAKGVFNGDVGYVEAIEGGGYAAKIKVRFQDGVASYDSKEALGSLSLAYACTVHKFQGSEAPLIFFVIPESSPFMLKTRNLAYTAITRAKSKCLVLGSENALRVASQRDALVGRKTRLKGLLDGSLTVDESASADVLAISERQSMIKAAIEEQPAAPAAKRSRKKSL